MTTSVHKWNSILVAASLATTLSFTPSELFAGPLAPPIGPVAPTGRTVLEIEPRIPIGPETTPFSRDAVHRISSPGNYYLTGDVQGISGKSGIEILASGVTLDLNGFTLRGMPGSEHGIVAAGAMSELRIMNGRATGWGMVGFNLIGANGAMIHQLEAIENGGNGLIIGHSAIVSQCIVFENGGIGITAQDGSQLIQCQSIGNGEAGFSVEKENTFTECVARLNDGIGIETDNSCIVQSCLVVENGNDGISISRASVVRSNSVFNNGIGLPSSAGIRATDTQVRIENNQIIDNNIGVATAPGGACLIVQNSVDNLIQDFLLQGTNTIGPLDDLSNPWANFSF